MRASPRSLKESGRRASISPRLRKLERLAKFSKFLMLRKPIGKVAGLVFGYFVMTFSLVGLQDALNAMVGTGATDLIASTVNLGYIFGSILYVERFRSSGRQSFLRRRSTMAVLVWIILYVIGIAWVTAAGGL